MLLPVRCLLSLCLTRSFALSYGASPADNPHVIEIRCIALPPQVGTHQSVTLPHQLPEHDTLSDMVPLGWIHTQTDNPQLSPLDVIQQARLLSDHRAFDGERCVVLTASFTPGSVSLSAYRLTPSGLEWGKQQRGDERNVAALQGYAPTMYERVPLLLSDRFVGSYLVPDNDVWNMNMQGVKHSVSIQYGMKLGQPRPFYDASFRPTHFLSFVDEDIMEEQAIAEAEDVFA